MVTVVALVLCLLGALPDLARAGGQSPVAEPAGPVIAPRKTPDHRLYLIESIGEIRRLLPERLALRHPVRLTATVTFSDPIWRTLYVQDATGGLLVRAESVPPLRVGDTVFIEGTTDTGDPLPVIAAAQLTRVASAPLPPARQFDLDRATSYLDDAYRVEVAGVIQHLAKDAPGHLIAEFVAADGSPMRITLADRWEAPLPEKLVDADIRVTGVLSRLVDPESQTRGLHLLVPSIGAIVVTGRYD